MPRRPTVRLVLDAATEQDIEALAAELRLTRSAVVRLAVSQLRKAQGLGVPAATAADVARHRRGSGGPRGPRPSRAAQRDQAAGESSEEG